MKTIFTTLIFLTSLIISTTAFAGNYGNVVITGVDITLDNYILYVSDYTGNGYNTQECLKTDWWWPVGTQYAFWFPKAGNEDLYKHFMIAYLTGKKVFTNAYQENLSYAAGIPCRIDENVNSLGNY